MIGLLAFMGVFLLIFSYFLFAPIYFEINSISGLIEFRFHKLISAKLKLIDASFFIEVKFFAWYKNIEFKKVSTSSGIKPEVKRHRSDLILKRPLNKIKAVLRSFKLNKCLLSLDTGDMKMNGVMFPVFYLLKYICRKNIGINFVGENLLILEIENNLARMGWAYLNS